MSKKKSPGTLIFAVAALILFVIWTALVKFVDVGAAGPLGSEVGFSSINTAFHALTGEHMALYNATDLLEVIPLLSVVCFGFIGLCQLIKRKSLLKVDPDILVLGVFYIVVIAAYVLFEIVEINYRPVLIEGVLEASYPSSTTLLVLCVMPTVMMNLDRFFKNAKIISVVRCVLAVYTVFMVVCRLISGVHWLTDIIGGALLSLSLVMFYISAKNTFSAK